MLELNDILKDDFKSGGFGMERECIRVDENCRISAAPHPACFGNKLTKKHITTDFSESQVEMITPVEKSIDDMYAYAEDLYDYVCANLDGEYLWCQSMPCIIDGDIPVARYEGELGRQATEYREMLVQKYGGERQLISGIHFNFSFSEEFLKKAYEPFRDRSYREFVDDIYLKLARNYIRYGFVITYLCGCSNVCHKSFDNNCIASLDKKDDDTYIASEGVSLRNSKWGYRNIDDLFPSYSSAREYVDSIHRFIDEDKLSYAKEYYSSIRLKGVSPHIESLKEDGIKYIELRTIDINPFSKVGVDIRDLKFTHLFLLLMLIKDEEVYEDYQKDGQNAKEDVALYSLSKPVYIGGKRYDAGEICARLIDEVEELNNILGLYDEDVIQLQRDKLNYDNTYAAKNAKMDFLTGSMALMKKYKDEADSGLKKLTKSRIEHMTEE